MDRIKIMEYGEDLYFMSAGRMIGNFPDYCSLLLDLNNQIDLNINFILQFADLYYGLDRIENKSVDAFKSFKRIERLDLNASVRDMDDVLKKDVYLYMCLRGFEAEKDITGGNMVLDYIQVDHPTSDQIKEAYFRAIDLFYMTFKKIMQYAEFIPYWLDKMLFKVAARFNDYRCYPVYCVELCEVLFMYGFLRDLIEYINEKKLIKGFSVNKSGKKERIRVR